MTSTKADPTATKASGFLARRSVMGLVIGAVVIASVLLLLSGSPIVRHQHNSCALCRLTRNDFTGLGRRWSEFAETECSLSYAENIEREHEHAWARSPSFQMRNIFGTPIGIADSDRPAGFMKLTPTEQVGVYRHIPGTDEARTLFLGMREDMESGDSARYRRVRTESAIVRDWVDSGFRRTWDEVQTEIPVE